jgi:hypothetical protein
LYSTFFLTVAGCEVSGVTLSAFTTDGEMVHEVVDILNRGPWMPTFNLWTCDPYGVSAFSSIVGGVLTITTDCSPIRQVARVSS